MEIKSFVLVAFFLQTVNYSTSQDVINRTFLNSENPSFLWTPTDEISVIVVQSEDEENAISVTVSNVDLKGETFMFIKGGDAEEDGIKEGRAFANKFSKTTQMLFRTTTVFGKLDWDRAKGTGSSVKILFELAEKFGPEPTTIPPTTTDGSSWPTTEVTDIAYIDVLVAGKTMEQFKAVAVQNAFKKGLVEMAEEYCKTENINLVESITQNNVFLTSITACPSSWPHSNTCVKITFKLPILHDENSKWQGYLLDKCHLKIMWQRLSDSILRKHGFSAYSDPDYKITFTWWIIGITAVIVGFIGLLWLFRELSLRFQIGVNKNKAKLSESSLVESSRTSEVSVQAHYLQPN